MWRYEYQLAAPEESFGLHMRELSQSTQAGAIFLSFVTIHGAFGSG
jgi:hypothetical protein